jgi:hypothetical protein
MVLASADENGTNILLKRIAEQFERSLELQSNVTVKISAHPVAPPLPNADPPLAQLEQQIADVINRVAVTTLGQSTLGANPEFELLLTGLGAPPESVNPADENAESFK